MTHRPTDRHWGFLRFTRFLKNKTISLFFLIIDEILIEFTDELIEINLFIFCDSNKHTLWLLESLDLVDQRLKMS